MRACSRACKGGGANKQDRIIQTATQYLGKLYQPEEKAHATLAQMRGLPLSEMQIFALQEIARFQDQSLCSILVLEAHPLPVLISDRLLEGRKIPAGEKLYSLFEQHSEWVAKGKSRPSVELGRRRLIHSYKS